MVMAAPRSGKEKRLRRPSLLRAFPQVGTLSDESSGPLRHKYATRSDLIADVPSGHLSLPYLETKVPLPGVPVSSVVGCEGAQGGAFEVVHAG